MLYSRTLIWTVQTTFKSYIKKSTPIWSGFFYIRHVRGEKSRIRGINSKRPAIIPKDKTIFEKLLKSAKFPFGPTADKPGPILLKVAATDENVVKKSLFSKEINSIKPVKVAQ